MANQSYVAAFAGVSISAAQDVFEIVAGTDKAVLIEEFVLGQVSDAGDAEAELLGISMIRGYTSSGSGGASVTPAAVNSNNGAASATVERNNTTQASTGTTVTLMAESFNVQAGFIYRAPLPYPWETFNQYLKRCVVVNPSERLVFPLTGPNDAITGYGHLRFTELG